MTKNFKAIQTLLEKSNSTIEKDRNYSQRYYFVNDVHVYCGLKMSEIYDTIEESGVEAFIKEYNQEDRLKRAEERKVKAQENKAKKKDPSVKKILKVLNEKMTENTLERLNETTDPSRKFICHLMNKYYSEECKNLCGEVTPSIFFRKEKEAKDLLKMSEAPKKKKEKKLKNAPKDYKFK